MRERRHGNRTNDERNPKKTRDLIRGEGEVDFLELGRDRGVREMEH